MKVTVKDIVDKKKRGEKIITLTAYDYPFARILDDAGVDIVLVGDSLGMVCLGYDSTVPVSMREMLHHTKAVTRAVRRALVVGDMPFGSFQPSTEKALRNATRFLKEGLADAVKLEGGDTTIQTTRTLVQAGISVMAHLGLTPQTASQLGGYKVQGKQRKQAEKIQSESMALEEAGAFSLVLECVPWQLAQRITEKLSIPTIGIGSGPYCDGQVLVLHDLLGLQEKIRPKFVRTYETLREAARKAVLDFRKDVLEGKYPSLQESFTMEEKELPRV